MVRQDHVFTASLLHPRFWLLWLGIGLWWLLCQLPYRAHWVLAGPLGGLMYRVGGSRKRIVEKNIALCFPELSPAEQAELVRKNFFSYGMAFFEVGISWWWSEKRLKRLVNLQGVEHLEALEGQGALLMGIHFTTFELCGQAINQDHSFDAMYRLHKNPVYEFVQSRGRMGRHADSVVFERKDVRGVIRALKKGRVIWYAPDQDYGRKQSVFAPFFGIPAASVTATAKLARVGQARVLPFFHYRKDDGTGYEVSVLPPLEDFPVGDEVADATRINSIVEEFIRQHPDQYLWAHRRFKTRPEGETAVYRK